MTEIRLEDHKATKTSVIMSSNSIPFFKEKKQSFGRALWVSLFARTAVHFHYDMHSKIFQDSESVKVMFSLHSCNDFFNVINLS